MFAPTGLSIGLLLAPLLLLAPPAVAERDADPGRLRSSEHRYQLALGSDWIPVSAAAPAIAGYRRPEHGQLLTITRLDYPNTAAWRNAASFFDQVEAGVAATATGYRRLSRSVSRDVLPLMDLWFQHQRGGTAETVAMRFLFFRAYTLILTVSTRSAAYPRQRRPVRKLLASFQPYLD
jgi:hypothetical protein